MVESLLSPSFFVSHGVKNIDPKRKLENDKLRAKKLPYIFYSLQLTTVVYYIFASAVINS